MKNIIGLAMFCALIMTPIVAADKEQEKKKQKLDENEQVIEEPKKKRIYKWTDEHGKVHYSDTPRKDAESMDIREINSVQSVVSETGKKLINPVKESEFEPERPVFRYKQFAIETPKDDEAVRSNDGVVQVVLKIEPDLRDRDRIKAYVDGEVREEKITSNSFILEGVERGTHTLKVELIGKDNRVLKTSSIKFHALKHSRLFNN